MKAISIIIPTFNEEATIEEAIRSACRHDVVEIIISDGGSVDATRTIATTMQRDDPRITVINEAQGRGRQLAAGARRATGELFVFLHCDNRLGGDLTEQMTDADWPVWGGFEQRIDDERWRFRWLEFGNAARARWFSRVFGDQGIFVDRTTYQNVGGFDEVDLMEDVLLSAKLKRIQSASLLPGKLVVSPRRWNQYGVVRQTVRNWMIQLAFALGVSPETLRRWYI
ncbi:TIGR04283 family arsenosugar biosynthesis glycosyltransferase [Neorhodopirellula pilleata]|uniref:GalNAc(5)-diNAcBac-PP-undecaprenol beta-1,3-glucosyltransferase n=1 Tax=Neorhodopirellula pilleata TaxID=2714738 RepID=A0A5C5ZRH9_9BACT|nr:TIGR04283 family arsenosugar biosynthesis glycosyltransferase [Neorhodopirellula pilleata]TWT89401.1 GalNAc(5)-diNAcBac-PP-undecaprenol beta-1,3-glucosyltransferase [Neorhodopirellula pilleata]